MNNSQKTPPDPLSGRIVGSCELMTAIGRGGMATVYLGRWLGARDFTKPVAIKALRPQYARDPDFAAMLLDEARIASRIRHANVVPTIDVVDDGGEIFIVMEYFEAVTVRRIVSLLQQTGGQVPVRVALRVMCGVLQGLHAAHEATDSHGDSLGVLHRDVSPENVLVCVDGHARLIDFGIARARERLTITPTGIVKGKLAYLSPEQVLTETVDRRTDIYSASVVLWELLAGRKLFTGASMLEAAEDILRAEIPAPSTLRERIPPSIDRIVARGLARKPEDRFQTAELMAAALEAVGPIATHREVGAWVRRVAVRPLRQIELLVQEAEKVPVGSMSGVRSRPRPAPEPDIEIDVSFTDGAGAATRRRHLFAFAALVTLFVASTAVWLVYASDDAAGGALPRSVEPLVPPPLAAGETAAVDPLADSVPATEIAPSACEVSVEASASVDVATAPSSPAPRSAPGLRQSPPPEASAASSSPPTSPRTSPAWRWIPSDI